MRQAGDVRVTEASRVTTSLHPLGRHPRQIIVPGNSPHLHPNWVEVCQRGYRPHVAALRTREEAGGSSSCLAPWKHQAAWRPPFQHLCLGPSALPWLLSQPQPASLCLSAG